MLRLIVLVLAMAVPNQLWAQKTGLQNDKIAAGFVHVIREWVAVTDHARTAAIATSCGLRSEQWSQRIAAVVVADLTQRISKMGMSGSDLSALALFSSGVFQGQTEALRYPMLSCDRIKSDGSLAQADAFLTGTEK